VKIIRIILIVTGMLLLLLLVFPPFVESGDFTRAIFAYKKTPSEQNKHELEHQRQLVHDKIILEVIIIAGALAANSLAFFWVSRRVKTQDPIARPY
jgi:hypothetical protein